MNWDVIAGMDGCNHVVPDRDLRPHRHSINCWCRPYVDSEDETVVIHNAMDNREQLAKAPQ